MSSASPTVSKVEESLRAQREAWHEISDRVFNSVSRELPIEAPKRILLFGVGSSLFAAKLSGYALLRDKTRVRIPVISCASNSIGVEVQPAKGDWVFAFSHRGGTVATLQAMEFCDRAGAFTILLAGQGVEPAGGARYVLATCAPEKVEPHTISITSAICAVTTLMLGAKAVEEWDAVRSIGEPDLEMFRERAGDGPSVLLGEYEGEWLAREGALKIMEMAKFPARAYATEEFFHGPRWATAPKDKIWHISHPKDARNAEFKPALQIGIFGASPLAWIPALVELQWLALAVALNRGEDPDVAPAKMGATLPKS